MAYCAGAREWCPGRAKPATRPSKKTRMTWIEAATFMLKKERGPADVRKGMNGPVFQPGVSEQKEKKEKTARQPHSTSHQESATTENHPTRRGKTSNYSHCPVLRLP